MTPLIIIGIVLILIFVLLETPFIFRVKVSIGDETEENTARISVFVGFICIFNSQKFLKTKKKKTKKIFQSKSKKKKLSKKSKKSSQNKKKSTGLFSSREESGSQTEETKIKKLKFVPSKVSFAQVKTIWNQLKKTTRNLCLKTKIYNFKYESIVGGDDAAVTAICFGAQSTIVYNSVEWFKERFDFKVNHQKQISIYTDFLSDNIKIKVNFSVRIKLITIISAGLDILFALLKNKL